MLFALIALNLFFSDQAKAIWAVLSDGALLPGGIVSSGGKKPATKHDAGRKGIPPGSAPRG